jgi:hypothetical protein
MEEIFHAMLLILGKIFKSFIDEDVVSLIQEKILYRGTHFDDAESALAVLHEVMKDQLWKALERMESMLPPAYTLSQEMDDNELPPPERDIKLFDEDDGVPF